MTARRLVIDASAVLKWYIKEELQKEALRVREDFLTGVVELIAPSYSLLEVFNRLEREPEVTAKDLYDLFELLQTRETSSEDLVRTFELVRKQRRAHDKRFTVYDALYVQLAIIERAHLLTADDVQARAALRQGCQVISLRDYR